MRIVLTGFRGTGKTTIGKKLALELGLKFIDVDSEIEKNSGKSIMEIFSQQGEKKFRNKEKQILRKIANNKNCVISTGGGSILDAENRIMLRKNSKIILLEASPETIIKRIKNHKQRPMLTKKNLESEVKELLAKRKTLYEKEFDLKINT